VVLEDLEEDLAAAYPVEAYPAEAFLVVAAEEQASACLD
jgi:hypothetical protein|tara:strand:- start:3064 stop:3180 length:117 start_codon:yes stop_codon:yes gene_type:complete